MSGSVLSALYSIYLPQEVGTMNERMGVLRAKSVDQN